MHDKTQPDTMTENLPETIPNSLESTRVIGPVWFDPPEYSRGGPDKERRLSALLIRQHNDRVDVIICHPMTGKRLYRKYGVPVERITPREVTTETQTLSRLLAIPGVKLGSDLAQVEVTA